MFEGLYHFRDSDYVIPRDNGHLRYHINGLTFDKQTDVYNYLRNKKFTDKESWQYIASLPMPSAFLWKGHC